MKSRTRNLTFSPSFYQQDPFSSFTSPNELEEPSNNMVSPLPENNLRNSKDETPLAIPRTEFSQHEVYDSELSDAMASLKEEKKQKLMMIKTQKIWIGNNHNMQSDNPRISTGVSKIELDISPQRPDLEKNLTQSSNVWSMTEDIGSNPYLTPAKKRLLGEKWFADTGLNDEEEADGRWKKEDTRTNKVSKFNRDRKLKEHDDSISEEESIDEHLGQIPGEEQKEIDNDNLFKIEEVEYKFEGENRGSRHGTVRLNDPNHSRHHIEADRPRRNTNRFEQPSQVNEERRISIIVSQSRRNTLLNHPSRRSLQAQPAIMGSRQYGPYSNTEAKLYLKRSLAFFIAITLISGSLLLIVDKIISFSNVFYLLIIYFFYYGMESIVRAGCIQREAWKKREDLMHIFDALCALLFIIIAILKLGKALSVSMIAAIPFLFTSFTYFAASNAPKITVIRATLVRLFYTTQVFLITAKLDKVINLDWEIIFSLSWLFLGVLGLYLISYSMIFVLAILFSLFRQKLFEDLKWYVQIMGLFWHVLFYGLSAIGFTALVGTSRSLQVNGTDELLRQAIIVGLSTSGCLALLTLIAFKPLTQFMEVFNHSHSNTDNAGVATENPYRRNQVHFEVEKKESYFVMLSSTYFLPMEKNFFSRNEQKIQKIKSIITNFSLWKSKKPSEDEPVDVHVLKGYKETLDRQFSKLANQPQSSNPTIKRSVKTKNPTVKVNNSSNKFLNDESLRNPDTRRSTHRLHLSADDINIKEISPGYETNKSRAEENLCYLCYSNEPNVVLMKCGHGGICYDCASTLIKKKNECMQCRSPVEEIYKIDPNPKLTDIIKGVEICKVNMV